jgi:hypothetical protein
MNNSSRISTWGVPHNDSGELKVEVTASALGTGGSTSANQVLANTKLDSIITAVAYPSLGTHGNLSSAITTAGVDEKSTSVDCQYVSKLSIFGHLSQACDVAVEYSQNSSVWYTSTISSWSALGDEDFEISISPAPAIYYRLSYSASGTVITATLAGKA